MRCEVLAELGHNHQGDLGTAIKLVDAAAAAGADAVKLQKRSNRHLYTKAFYEAPYNSENAYGATYGEHREFLELEMHDYRVLRLYAEDHGMKFYATAFDFPSVDFLVEAGVDGIKIASGDVTNIPLIRYASMTDLPLMVSTGACTWQDMHRVVSELQSAFTLMHCTASYPCPPEELDLGVIPQLVENFASCRIGASLHDNGIWSAVAAYVLGARCIEKHFTLDRTMKGTDHAFSLEPQGLAKMIRDLRRAETAMGSEKVFHPSEVSAQVKMGKSLYAARDLPAGTVMMLDDIAMKSPACEGLAPYRLDDVLGRRLLRDLAEDEPITEGALHEQAEDRGVRTADA